MRTQLGSRPRADGLADRITVKAVKAMSLFTAPLAPLLGNPFERA